MKNKFTLGLAALAVALGAYMVFVEAKKEAPTESQEVSVWSLTDNQAKDLDTLVITADGKDVTYKREGDFWRLSSEPKRELDPGSWDVPFSNLKNLTASRKIEEKPADLGKYGLQTPATTVRWGDEKTPYKLTVGNKNPAGDAYYVRSAKDETVYTVSSWKIDDWRKWATNPPLAALPSPSPSIAASPAPSGTPASPAAAPSK